MPRVAHGFIVVVKGSVHDVFSSPAVVKPGTIVGIECDEKYAPAVPAVREFECKTGGFWEHEELLKCKIILVKKNVHLNENF